MPDDQQSQDNASEAQNPHEMDEQSRPTLGQPHSTEVSPETSSDTTVRAETTMPEQVASHVSAGNMILQWLTYAFWGWTVLALAWLTYVTVGSLVDSSNGPGSFAPSIAYPLASVIVLYIISIATDFFYSRIEPTKKSGMPMIIMIIHTVIFALFGIGFLVAAVFGLVQLLLNTGTTDTGESAPKTVLIGSLIIALVYAVTLLRTLRPKQLLKIPLFYWVFMTGVVITMLILAVVGPIAQTNLTKNDRVIESGLPEVSQAINDYANRVGTLPKSLGTLSVGLSDNARQVIDNKLVKYEPGNLIEVKSLTPLEQTLQEKKPVYTYELCVEYAAKSAYYNTSYNNDYDRSSYGQTSVDTYSHKAGTVCYDVQTGVSE